jgi:G3E family GTPase
VFDFDRVIVETTGLADPAPVVQTLASDTLLEAQYRLDGLITLVDGVLGLGQIQDQTEAVKQIAIADKVFITKSDLADAPTLQALRDAIGTLNPRASIDTLVNGEIEPQALMALGLASARAGQQTLRFLGEALDGSTSKDAAEGGRYLAQAAVTHDRSVRTVSLRFKQPFQWTSFSAALELLSTLRGPDLLRVKGIVNVDGKPVVVQGVQHIFHTPVELDRWPSADTDSRLVFITRNIESEVIRNLFAAVGAITSAS